MAVTGVQTCALRSTLWHAFEVGDVKHLPLITAGRVVLGRVDEQATTEQVLPGSLGGHFHGQVVVFCSP